MIMDEFWLGNENFDAAPEVGKFATVKAGSTVLTVVADAPAAGQFAVKIEDTKPLTEGMVDTGTLYRCTVIGVPDKV